MEQLKVPQWKILFFILSVTVNQSVMDFEWGALTGIGREEQVHLIWIIIGLSYVARSPADSVHQPGMEKVDFWANKGHLKALFPSFSSQIRAA